MNRLGAVVLFVLVVALIYSAAPTLMATGYSKAELDALLHIMDEAVPPIPIDSAKAIAPRVIAMRASGAEKGLLLNLETKEGTVKLF